MNKNKIKSIAVLLLLLVIAVSVVSTVRSLRGAAQPAEVSQAEETRLPEAGPAPEDPGKGASTAEQSGQDSTGPPEEAAIDESGSYTSKEDVALYLWTYGKLPGNFITKSAAEKLGWEGGSLEKVAKGKCIGGDRFGNYEKLLPQGVKYRECDIDTLGAKSRGEKRIVYAEDCSAIYYTEDHYESFEQLY